MKKFLTLFTIITYNFIISASNCSAQTPTWIWAKGSGGSDDDICYSVATDPSGNVYAAGGFISPTITIGATTLINAGQEDIFLAKYDPSGNVIWAKSYGGITCEKGWGVATDANGFVYITGNFDSDSLNFGSVNLINTSTPGNMLFLVKLDSAGNSLWGRAVGCYNWFSTRSTCITVDNAGDVYIAGDFTDTEIIFDTITLNGGSAYYYSDFIAKYNSSGGVIWARIVPSFCNSYINSITTDQNNNVFIIGEFRDQILHLDNLTISNPWGGYSGSTNSFTAKYNSSGIIQWAKSYGGSDYETGRSITADHAGNIYITGSFASSTVSFDTINLPLSTGGNSNTYITKVNTNGNAIWAKKGSSIDNQSYSITTDPKSNVYVTGYFVSDSVRFGNISLSNSGSFDTYIVKYDSSGIAHWAKTAIGIGWDRGMAITANGFNIYTSGYYTNNPITFDGITLTNSGKGDFYLAKIAVFSVSTTQSNVSCYGGGNGTATATAIGGGTSPYTYHWNTAPAQTTQTATGLVAGNYTVTVTDADSISYTANVTIFQPSEILVNNPQTICNGDSYIINGHTYDSTGIYNDTLTAINGCDSIVVTQLSVYPYLPVSVSIIASANPVCTGISETFTATPTNGGTVPIYQWKVNGVYIGTNSPTFTTSTLINNDVVTCNLTSNISCDNPATSNSVIVTVNTLPAVTAITLADTICIGYCTNLNAGGANNYVWSPGGLSGATLNVCPTVSTTYTVTGTATNGCTNTATVFVFVDPCTGVCNYNNSAFALYPNPSDGQFTLVLDEPANIEIYNTLGGLIYNASLVKGKNNFTLNNSQGVYLLKATSEKTSMYMRMVIQK